MKKHYWFDGIIKYNKQALRSYKIFHSQKQRCENPSSHRYYLYGAKGVRVEYSAREFIGWYLENLEKKKWIRPTTGRIDHSKNYSFDNIEMQEVELNTKDVWNRHGPKLKAKRVAVFKGSKKIAEFDSQSSAARAYGLCRDAISRVLIGRVKRARVLNGLTFRRIS